MSDEITCRAKNGWFMLAINVIIYGLAIYFLVKGILIANSGENPLWMFVCMGICFIVGIIISVGLFILQPNQAGALVLFGNYQGTVKENGFWWRNPLTSVNKISLRARNLNGERLKVNDKNGNPIEIAAVVVWRVNNTAQALFDVDDYEEYVDTQSEAAIRHLAGFYPYDASDDDGDISLRQSKEEVNEKLQIELQERLGRAGVEVQEARISHLAYAPEIAGAMLRRQQAEAIIAARKKIVEGAVSMVEMALDELSAKHVVELDEERKATMVSNLLVVLCGEEPAHPVVNTGTLYS